MITALISRFRSITPAARFGMAAAVIVFAADQASKLWVLNGAGLKAAGPGSRIEVLDPWFNFTMVWNRGVSFGMFAADSLWQRAVLIGVSLAIAGLLAYWLMSAQRRLQAGAFGLIIGGAIGNVVDRVAYGAVADFLDFSGLWFPYVFNVADAAISVGVAMMIADLLIHGDKAR